MIISSTPTVYFTSHPCPTVYFTSHPCPPLLRQALRKVLNEPEAISPRAGVISDRQSGSHVETAPRDDRVQSAVTDGRRGALISVQQSGRLARIDDMAKAKVAQEVDSFESVL